MILALHHERLAESLELDRTGEVEVELSRQEHLGRRVGECGPVREPAREGFGGTGELLVLDHLGREADLESAVRREVVPEHEELHGPPEAHEPRQEVRGAHVGAGEADSREQECKRCRARQEAEVARKREHRSGSGGDPVDRSDDREGALAHRLHDRARHPREGKEVGRLGALELADDLLHIPAGAEPAPLAREDEHSCVSAVRELAEQVAEVGVDVEGERIQLVRARQRHRRDPVGNAELEILPALRERG